MVGYLVNTDVWIFPPGRIRLWAGDDPERLTPLEVGYDPLRLDAGQKRSTVRRLARCPQRPLLADKDRELRTYPLVARRHGQHSLSFCR